MTGTGMTTGVTAPTTATTTTVTTAAAVVESYRQRARFCRAETTDVHRPRLLRSLLDAARHVAEIPCGTGHFLTDYAHAGTTVTLVDACPDMLAAATEQALDAGLPGERVHAELSMVQQVPALTGVDLVVMPNGALNQLARQTSPTKLLARLRSAMRPGAEVLAQVVCTHPGGGTDSSTFYDPGRQHGLWFADRWFAPAHTGGAILRRRRQHRDRHCDGETLRIEFDYRTPAGDCLHTAVVEVALLSAGDLTDAFTTAGFAHVRFLPGHSGLSELLATTCDRARR